MSKRRSTEDIIVEYFTHANPDAAAAIYGVVKGIMKRRTSTPATPSTPTVKKRRTKRTTPAAPATSFPPAEVVA